MRRMMISKQSDRPVTPFLLRFAQRLSHTPPVQAATDDKTGTPSVTCPDTRLTKVAAETTDDA